MAAMKRRHFLAGCTGALLSPLGRNSATQAADTLVRPAALREGDTVGLITPAAYVSDPDRLLRARRTVEYFGLRPKFGKNVGRRAGYLGGSTVERVADLHEMFEDQAVKAVWAIRGGVGSTQLLDRIDYALMRQHPKIFIGYSDITALHLAIQKRCGLITFHGPVVVSPFSEFTETHFRRALFETKPLGSLSNPPAARRLRPQHPLRTVKPGRARGRLAGGNLSLICATMGTPFEIDTRGCLLLLEDVDEEPYSIDQMLTQLRLAGKLDGVAGILFGECSNCRPRDYKPGFESSFSVGEVIDQILGDLKVPILSGLVFGHTDDQLTIPLGVTATLDADKGELIVEEPAVS